MQFVSVKLYDFIKFWYTTNRTAMLGGICCVYTRAVSAAFCREHAFAVTQPNFFRKINSNSAQWRVFDSDNIVSEKIENCFVHNF